MSVIERSIYLNRAQTNLFLAWYRFHAAAIRQLVEISGKASVRIRTPFSFK